MTEHLSPRPGGAGVAPLQRIVATPALRLLGALAFLALTVALVVWGVDLGTRIGLLQAHTPGPDAGQQRALLEVEVTRLSVERDQLVAAAHATASAQQHSAQRQSALESENRRLGAALALVESELADEKVGPGVDLRALRVGLLAPDRLHYVLLLTHGGRKGAAAFAGRVQLAVTLEKDGKRAVVQFPDASDPSALDVTVRRYQRVDGVLVLPPGAVATSVQVSVLENGKVLRRRSAPVSPLTRPSAPGAA